MSVFIKKRGIIASGLILLTLIGTGYSQKTRVFRGEKIIEPTGVKIISGSAEDNILEKTESEKTETAEKRAEEKSETQIFSSDSQEILKYPDGRKGRLFFSLDKVPGETRFSGSKEPISLEEEVRFYTQREKIMSKLPQWNLVEEKKGVWYIQTEHFSVESSTGRADAAWAAHALEDTYQQARIITSMWGRVDVNAPNTPAWRNIRVQIGKTPWRGEKNSDIWNRSREDDENLLYWDVGKAQYVAPEMVLRQMRREFFHILLKIDGDALRFPRWIQDGLSACFSGEPLPISDKWITDSDMGNIWVRYILTADDAVRVSPFFKLLKDMSAENSDISVEEPLLLARSLDKSYLNKTGTDLNDWLGKGSKDAFQIRIPREWSEKHYQKQCLLMYDMAFILKIAWRYEKETGVKLFTDNKEKTYTGAVDKKMEGSEKTEKDPSSASLATEKQNSEHAEQSRIEDSDLAPLMRVYEWFIQNGNTQHTTLGPHGEILLSSKSEKQIKKLFYPRNRGYLLQEYDGKPVLTATLSTGEVFHVILELDSEEPSRYIVRVLAQE